MELIGRIVKLQVQRYSMKQGNDQHFWYDTGSLAWVPELEATPDGAVGFTESGEAIVDVHNRSHPQSRRRVANALSIGMTSHYAAMRARFGPHVVDGVAGENFLVEAGREQTIDDVKAGLVIVNAEGERVDLVRVEIAEPCLKFSRFVLGMAPEEAGGPHVTVALKFLRNGRRGFYATYDGPAVRVKVGAQMYINR